MTEKLAGVQRRSSSFKHLLVVSVLPTVDSAIHNRMIQSLAHGIDQTNKHLNIRLGRVNFMVTPHFSLACTGNLVSCIFHFDWSGHTKGLETLAHKCIRKRCIWKSADIWSRKPRWGDQINVWHRFVLKTHWKEGDMIVED